MSTLADLEKMIYQRKNSLNLEGFHIKESISAHLGARLYVGQTLFFSYKTINRRHKKGKISLARFIKQVARENRQMSPRNYLRSFRIFEGLVVDAGFWTSELEDVDFIHLARIAECRTITALTRRELVKGIQKCMEAGDTYSKIAKRLGEVLEAYRERPPRIPDVVAKVDHRISDMKMDFRLIRSAKDPPAPKLNLPDDYWDIGLPRVVINWDKLKGKQ